MPSKPTEAASAKPQVDKKELSVNNYIAVMVTCGMLAVVISLVLLNTLGHSIIKNTKLISHKSKAKSQLQKNVDNATQLVSAYKGLGNDQQLIEDALPVDPGFPQLVATAENMANSAGLRLLTVVPSVATGAPTAAGGAGASTSSSGSGVQTTSFEMDTIGTYDQVAQLAQNIELSARPMRVRSISFKGTDQGLKSTLIIDSYYQGKADINTKTEVLK